MPLCRHLLLALLAASLMAGCGKPAPPAPASRSERIDTALTATARYLRGRQGPDGAWRSDTYGAFKDGASLTPLVLDTLLTLDEGDLNPACRKGCDYLAELIRPDLTLQADPPGPSYPAYTGALSVIVLSNPRCASYRPARDRWLAYLRRRQLNESLGWRPDDAEFGGWGFGPEAPCRPADGSSIHSADSPNLSATAFALEALRAAGCGDADPAFRQALAFLRRCQNFGGDPALDDGGFFFIPGDAQRNKAAVAGRDPAGRERYHSYGSATADGLRALLACGLPPGDDRTTAACQWISRHFRADHHPGQYAANREAGRDAVYYYWCWSAARALRAARMDEAGGVCWADALADELLRRQREDGSWRNPLGEVREDDPVTATALAAAALARCRTQPGAKEGRP